jgi:hypothetical protein
VDVVGKREAHIRELADELGIAELKILSRPFSAFMPRNGGYVPTGGHVGYGAGIMPAHSIVLWGHEQWGQIDYALALHELGHAAHRHVRNPFDFGSEILRDESQAWLWGIEHTREPLSKATWKFMVGDPQHAFGSYMRDFGWLTKLPDEVTQLTLQASVPVYAPYASGQIPMTPISHRASRP